MLEVTMASSNQTNSELQLQQVLEKLTGELVERMETLERMLEDVQETLESHGKTLDGLAQHLGVPDKEKEAKDDYYYY